MTAALSGTSTRPARTESGRVAPPSAISSGLASSNSVSSLAKRTVCDGCSTTTMPSTQSHVEQAVHRVREDRLAAEPQELLGLPVRQPHPLALAGGGDDDPGLPGLLILHVHPLPVSVVVPAAERSRG